MPNRNTLGGIIHTYQKYDPVNLPAPTQPPRELRAGLLHPAKSPVLNGANGLQCSHTEALLEKRRNMAKESLVRARVAAELKENAEKVLAQLGLSTSQAITLFLKQVELRRGLPFQVE